MACFDLRPLLLRELTKLEALFERADPALTIRIQLALRITNHLIHKQDREIATLVGMDTSKYATMNNGHKRMVIGGSLRRRVRDQDKLHVQNPQYIKSGEQWLNDLVAQVRR